MDTEMIAMGTYSYSYLMEFVTKNPPRQIL